MKFYTFEVQTITVQNAEKFCSLDMVKFRVNFHIEFTRIHTKSFCFIIIKHVGTYKGEN